MREELVKEALLRELVALGAKDIPHTPRLLMKFRGPAARAALGESAARAYGKVSAPLMRGVEAVAKHVPEGVPKVIRKAGRSIAEGVAKDPVGGLISAAAPGGLAGVPIAKRLLTKGIRFIDPQAARLMVPV